MLRELVARVFNLITSEEYNLLNMAHISQRETIHSLRLELSLKQELLDHEMKERQELQQIIFRNFGVLQGAREVETEPSELQPIPRSARNVMNIMRSMESDDRRRIQANEQTKDAAPFSN